MAHSKSEQRQRCHQLQNDGVESHRQAISQTFLSKDSGAKFDMPPARVGPRQSHTTGTIPFELLDRLIYAPKGYYLVEDRYRRPWGVMLRIFLVNLPHQEGSYSHEPERWEDETCNDSGDEKETDKWFHALETAPDTKKRHPGVPWRDYAPANTQLAVAFGMETPCGTYMCGCCQQWGRRIVFEPELLPPGREQDRWLAVAYVIGKDRRWVEDVDVRDIISFESSHW